MIRIIFFLFVLFQTCSILAQEDVDQLKQQHPAVAKVLFDQGNSIPVKSLSYSDVPKYLDFRGTLLQALSWTDNRENLLLLTASGHFVKQNQEAGSDEYERTDQSELYVYLFQKQENNPFELQWRVFDFNECFGVDWYTGFIPKSITITDIDKDGESEISLPYVLICRGGMDPGTMKIICYEGDSKYALRGETMICMEENSYGGAFKPSENLGGQAALMKHLKGLWDRHKCEIGRFY